MTYYFKAINLSPEPALKIISTEGRGTQIFEKMRGEVHILQRHSAKGINSAMTAGTNMMAIKAIDCWL